MSQEFALQALGHETTCPLANGRVDMYIEEDTVQFHFRVNLRFPDGGSAELMDNTSERTNRAPDDIYANAQPGVKEDPNFEVERGAAVDNQRQQDVTLKQESGKETEMRASLRDDMEEDKEVDHILALPLWEQESQREGLSELEGNMSDTGSTRCGESHTSVRLT
jgi:hypothetical protein